MIKCTVCWHHWENEFPIGVCLSWKVRISIYGVKGLFLVHLTRLGIEIVTS